MVKKFVILCLLFLVFVKVVTMVNQELDNNFFDGFYSDVEEVSERDTAWDKIQRWFKQKFSHKEEKYIYK